MPYSFLIGSKTNYSEDPSKRKQTYRESLRTKLTMDPKSIFISSIPVSTGDIPASPPSTPTPTISSITCNSVTYSGLPSASLNYIGTATVPYLGGNGLAYSMGTPINSTTVTGLTAILRGGTLNSGAGSLIYDIEGKASAQGTANFAISFGGQSCNLAMTVQAAPPSVTIAGLKWSTKNMDITTYSDGTPIPQVTDGVEWIGLTTGAWCWYNNDSGNNSTYGKMYNWYAVAGIYDAASLSNPSLRKSFAPTGFRVPTKIEWQSLFDSYANVLDLIDVADGGTNTSGFSARNAGYRLAEIGDFGRIGSWAEWWGSTEDPTNPSQANNAFIDSNSFYLNDFYFKREGSSVRLIIE